MYISVQTHARLLRPAVSGGNLNKCDECTGHSRSGRSTHVVGDLDRFKWRGSLPAQSPTFWFDYCPSHVLHAAQTSREVSQERGNAHLLLHRRLAPSSDVQVYAAQSYEVSPGSNRAPGILGQSAQTPTETEAESHISGASIRFCEGCGQTDTRTLHKDSGPDQNLCRPEPSISQNVACLSCVSTAQGLWSTV